MPHWPIYIGPDKNLEVSLLRTKLILKFLHSPHLLLKNIFHITGTKGKGSSALYVSNILKESGYTVNTYISPHIYQCNERILINGKAISDKYLYILTEKVRVVCEENYISPSCFESMTVTAMLAFAENRADFNIIEVGMGGRLDATNLFEYNPPLVAIFTPIHLDHKIWLGDSIAEISWNKAFIAQKDTKSVVISAQSEQALSVLLPFLQDRQIENIYLYGRDYEVFKNEYDKSNLVFESEKLGTFSFPVPKMQGDHQLINASCAIASVLSVIDVAENVTQCAIERAILNTINIVRLEKVESGCLINALPKGSIFYVDGAHNQLSSYALANFIRDLKKQNNNYLIFVAVSRSKGADNQAFLSCLAIKEVEMIICTRANLESLPEPPENLAQVCCELNIKNTIAYSIKDAVDIAAKVSDGRVCYFIATGSLYIARDIRKSS